MFLKSSHSYATSFDAVILCEDLNYCLTIWIFYTLILEFLRRFITPYSNDLQACNCLWLGYKSN
nr:MAG TPA: hypothetical protein [Bacteriophage sp.]